MHRHYWRFLTQIEPHNLRIESYRLVLTQVQFFPRSQQLCPSSMSGQWAGLHRRNAEHRKVFRHISLVVLLNRITTHCLALDLFV